MRVPANKIIKGYTAGKEYTYKKSSNFYIGHYYKLYNRYYAGRDYDPNAKQLELTPVTKTKAIDNPNSFIYNVLTGAKAGLNVTSVSNRPSKSAALASIAAANKQGFAPVVGVNLEADKDSLRNDASQIQQSSTPVEVKRYFYRKRISNKPLEYKIGEVNENEYNNIKRQPIIYSVAIVTETRIDGMQPQLNTDELETAEKKIPGLKNFLGISTEQ